MKKILCVAIALSALILCLTSCSFYIRRSGALVGETEVKTNVEEMMSYLASGQIEEAKALMHPDADGDTDKALTQISNYLRGYEVSSIEQSDAEVKSSSGASEKTRQEQLTYDVTLNSGENILLYVSYLSNNDGDGFTSFQLVLGTN